MEASKTVANPSGADLAERLHDIDAMLRMAESFVQELRDFTLDSREPAEPESGDLARLQRLVLLMRARLGDDAKYLAECVVTPARPDIRHAAY